MAVGTLYFHSPCFDGIASAVLAWDFFAARHGWPAPDLHPVNYDRRETWLGGALVRPAVVVDFLYHPDALFWADHHVSAFLAPAARADFERRHGPDLIYDERAPSCAGLLWARLHERFGHRNPCFAELVHWADKIDAARYDSVDEALSSAAPALQLNLSLALGDADGYCQMLVRQLREKPLAEVAALTEPRERIARARMLLEEGLERFKRTARLEDDGIVVFDVDSTDSLVSRYAPYHVFPEARYSAGIIRWKDGAKVTAMRNPWREFPSAPLGQIAAGFGGGGHQRVGSIALQGKSVVDASRVLGEFVAKIREHERSGSIDSR